MIGKIGKSTHFRGIIDYHEKKVANDEAKLIYNDTLETNKNGRIKNFLNTTELNPNVTTNKCIHVSFNFTTNDLINDEKCISAMKDVMKSLGYNNNQMLIYRHFDKEHPHYHLVTSSVKLDGTKVNDWEDHIKVQKHCRTAEKKYGFEIPKEKNAYEANLSNKAYAMNSYSIHKALKKINRDPLLNQINNLLPENQTIQQIVTKPKNNYQIKQLIDDENSYNELTRRLQKAKLLQSSKIIQLRKLLLDTYKISKTNYEFLDNCKKLNIYFRPLIKNGKTYFIYGHDGFYAKDHKINKNITYNKLFKTADIQEINKKVSFEKKDQLSFLMRNVYRAAKVSSNLEEFKFNCAIRNIDPVFSSNKRGIYGVSFKSNQIDSAILFKGSDLNMSFTKLSNILHENNKNLEYSKFAYKNSSNIIETSNNSKLNIKSIRPSPEIRGLSHYLSGDDKELRKLELRLKREEKDEGQNL